MLALGATDADQPDAPMPLPQPISSAARLAAPCQGNLLDSDGDEEINDLEEYITRLLRFCRGSFRSLPLQTFANPAHGSRASEDAGAEYPLLVKG